MYLVMLRLLLPKPFLSCFVIQINKTFLSIKLASEPLYTVNDIFSCSLMQALPENACTPRSAHGWS